MSSRAPYGASVQQEIHSLKVRLDFKVAWILRIIVPMQFIHCCCFFKWRMVHAPIRKQRRLNIKT